MKEVLHSFPNWTRTKKKENYRPLFLMNIDAKFFDKIFVNQIQQQIKRSSWFHSREAKMVQHIQMDKCNKAHKWNQRKKFTWSSQLIQRKPLTKFNVCFFLIKALKKLGIEGLFLNIRKAVYDKPTTNIILNGEKLESYSLKSGM
jgi:hypothetical protein